jgi:hypothetical protein
VIPEGKRSPFRKQTDQASERSDAGTSILPRLIGIVKWNLSGAKRRKHGAAAKGVRGKGRQPFAPPQHAVTPSATSARSNLNQLPGSSLLTVIVIIFSKVTSLV